MHFEHENFLDELAALFKKYKVRKVSVDADEGAVVFSNGECFLNELLRFEEFEDQGGNEMLFSNVTVNYNYFAYTSEDENNV